MKIEQRRRLLRGSGERQTAQSQPICGTPEEVPQPSTVTRMEAGLGEQAMEVGGGGGLDLGHRKAPDLGQHLATWAVKAGSLVRPRRDRREIGRVGFQQQVVQRHVAHRGPQLVGFLEGQDTADAKIEADRRGAFGEAAARAVAVDDAGEGPGPISDSSSAMGVVVGVAGVNDQRQAS